MNSEGASQTVFRKQNKGRDGRENIARKLEYLRRYIFVNAATEKGLEKKGAGNGGKKISVPWRII